MNPECLPLLLSSHRTYKSRYKKKIKQRQIQNSIAPRKPFLCHLQNTWIIWYMCEPTKLENETQMFITLILQIFIFVQINLCPLVITSVPKILKCSQTIYNFIMKANTLNPYQTAHKSSLICVHIVCNIDHKRRESRHLFS